MNIDGGAGDLNDEADWYLTYLTGGHNLCSQSILCVVNQRLFKACTVVNGSAVLSVAYVLGQLVRWRSRV